MSDYHIDSYEKFVEMVESAKVTSAGPTLKGNAIQVRIRFTGAWGKSSIGYYSVPSNSDFNRIKMAYHDFHKAFRITCGSATRNAIENWIRTNPPSHKNLRDDIVGAAKEALVNSNVMERKNQAVVAKCNKALREWGIHALKNGMTRDEIVQIVDECVVKATMDD